MKHLAIIVLLLSSCSDLRHKNFLLHTSNDWEKDHLKGKVKQLIENEYENGQLVYMVHSEYNETGFLIRNKKTPLEITLLPLMI